MPKTITLAQLKAVGSCDQIDEFERLFGTEVEVTEDLCVEHADIFDWDLAAENFLSKAALDAYNDAAEIALDVYDATVKSARDTIYRMAVNSTLDAYRPDVPSIWDISIANSAWLIYRTVVKAAFKISDVTLARAFARAYLSE